LPVTFPPAGLLAKPAPFWYPQTLASEGESMKVVILCGGLGTRLSEETHLRPKPMVAIGDRPILWHIMNSYSHYGYNEFLLALGYKSHVIKEYFLNFHSLNSDLRVDLKSGSVEYLRKARTDWQLDMIDTGEQTQTGGRVKRLQSQLTSTFMLTYGDGVSNVGIQALLRFHKAHGKIATVTGVRPPARFGEMVIDGGEQVVEFREKPQTTQGWINGGFFVFEPEIFNYLDDDDSVLEREPMERLARDGQLMAYKHDSFWQCVDTLRDLRMLEDMWRTGDAPWKVDAL
jgi:glucose-1-phosphate cytidylyltransferase